ncbi:MAG: CHASE2 domain-containing protein [Burkholderiaceae bacterium]
MNSIVASDAWVVAESQAVQRARVLIYWGAWLFLAVGLWFWPAWHLLEEQARDGLSRRFLVSEARHSQVVLVDFSDASIQALGGWPLPRARMADLVEELIGPLGAKVVALDMVFPEPADALGDARLASLATHGPLVLAQVLDMAQRSQVIRVGVPAKPTAPVLLSGVWPVVPSQGFVANHTGLAQARCVGHIGIALDADGVVRRLAPLVAGPEGVVSTLAGAMLDCGQPQQPGSRSDAPLAAPWWLALGGGSAGSAQGWRLPFLYGLGAFDTVMADEVLSGAVSADRVRGKYVLVGSSAVGLSDYVNTPLQPLTPGVLVHAQALAQWLDQGLPRPVAAERWWGVVVALLCSWGVWCLWRSRKRSAWALAVILAVGWPAAALWGWSDGLGLPALWPPGVVLGALLAVSALELKLLRDLKQRALMTLSHYVAKPVLQQLYALGLSQSLQPQLREITVLVVDMRSYTQLTEEMPLEKMAILVRDYLERITEPVLAFEGTLDRYSGDGLIALWGAPLPRVDHADMALRCARELQLRVRAWNAERVAMGEEAIGIRIGIESGQALVGDLGSSARSVFTALGTCINTASRLQELGRQLDCDVVVGPAAAALTSLDLQPLAVVEVKGLRSALQVFTWKS